MNITSVLKPLNVACMTNGGDQAAGPLVHRADHQRQEEQRDWGRPLSSVNGREQERRQDDRRPARHLAAAASDQVRL